MSFKPKLHIDALIFSMDGVLVDASASYREVVRKTVQLYLEQAVGLERREPAALHQLADQVARVRVAGAKVPGQLPQVRPLQEAAFGQGANQAQERFAWHRNFSAPGA